MFVWSEKYSIDGSVVDAEHQKLFQLSNAVLELDSNHPDFEKFKQLVNDLYQYVQTHFENEQSLMVQLGYPQADEHERQHNSIILEMNRYLQSYHTSTDLLAHFKQLANKWISQHILTEDLKFKMFLIKMRQHRQTSP